MKPTAFVSGGSRGIGLGIARSLTEHGFDVLINGVRPLEEVSDVLELLNRSEGTAEYCQGNIALAEDRTKIVEYIQKKWEHLHVLINNAGVAPRQRLDMLELDEEDFDRVMNINLKGTYFLTRDICRWMLSTRPDPAQTFRCVINISSISAKVASVNRAAYCLSKAGLSMLTQLLAVRLSENDIPVYEVQPGIIETDMTSGVLARYQQKINDGLLLERRVGSPNDVGKIVAALAQGNLPYATGQMITCDGGLTLRRL